MSSRVRTLELTFGPGKGMVLENINAGPSEGGDAELSVIESLAVYCTRPEIDAEWEANLEVTVGMTVTPTNFGGIYLECIAIVDDEATGDTGVTEPPWFHPSAPDTSVNWHPGLDVRLGTAVRATVFDNPDWILDTAHLGTLFRCILPDDSSVEVAAASMGDPNWDFDFGDETTDGNPAITWKAFPGADSLVLDNEVWWAVRVHSGIVAKTPFRASNIAVQNALNAGITVLGNSESACYSSASLWHIDQGRLEGNGVGIYVRGENANAGSAFGLDIVGDLSPGGVGILDGGFIGNSWFGCSAQFNGKYDVWAAGAASTASFFGCYAESDPPRIRLEGLSQAFGGTNFQNEDFVQPPPTATEADDDDYLTDVPGYGSSAPSFTVDGGHAVFERAATTGDFTTKAFLTGGAWQAFTQQYFHIPTGSKWDQLGWQYQDDAYEGWWAYIASNSNLYIAFAVAGTRVRAAELMKIGIGT